MDLTDEQAEKIREHLLTQLNNVPEESRAEIKKEIELMNKEQLAALVKKEGEADLEGGEASSCVFCSIVSGGSPSIKIDENDEAIAIMDINPISKGHVLVIPKEHNKEPTQVSQELAFKIGKKIFDELKPKDITTRASKVNEHTFLNVIPIYDDTDFEKRTKISQEELMEVAQKIGGSPVVAVKKEPEVVEQKEPVCVFCSIANSQSDSVKVDENKDSVAVLEINPVSKGHLLVVPKKHLQLTEIPVSSFTLARKLAKKIKNKFKPNDIKINPTSVNNHSLIEVIPIYDDSDLSKRQSARKEDLLKLQKKLVPKKSNNKPKEKEDKHPFIPKRKYPDLPFIPPRIP